MIHNDLVLGTPRETASSHQSCECSNLQKGSSVRITCCWICWSLQITFLCSLCWFYVVRPGNTLLSYLPFSLLCSPCCLLFQNKYAHRLPLEAGAPCSSPESVQIFAPHQSVSPETWAVTRGGAAEGRGGRPEGVKLAHGSERGWLGALSKRLPCLQSTRKKGTLGVYL